MSKKHSLVVTDPFPASAHTQHIPQQRVRDAGPQLSSQFLQEEEEDSHSGADKLFPPKLALLNL